MYRKVQPQSVVVPCGLLLLLIFLSHCVSFPVPSDASSANVDNDSNGEITGEDFEEENSIQMCCTWGSNLRDGKLTYNIDNIDSSKEQQDAVRNAIEEWDSKIGPLDLERISSITQPDIRVEFEGGSDKKVHGEEIAGETLTTFDQFGFLDNAKVTIYKEPYGHELDTSEIEQVVKHEMGHALGLGHANFDGNLMAQRVNDGTDTISDCEVKAAIEANHWKLGDHNLDNTYPYFPEDESAVCEDDS